MTIAATKPTDIPRWADLTPGADRLAPSSGQMDHGWTNGQRPPFNVANWLQGVVYDWQQYLEDATDQLESTKLNRDGSGTEGQTSGHILPDTDSTWDLGRGNTVRAFRRIFGDLIVAGPDTYTTDPFAQGLIVGGPFVGTFQMGSAARVASDFVADTNGTRQFGGASNRWDAFTDALDTNTVVVRTSILPNAVNTQPVGSNAKAFSDVVSYIGRFKDTLICYEVIDAPSTATQLIQVQQNNNLICHVGFAARGTNGACTISGTPFNVSGVSRTGTGTYVITFNTPVIGRFVCTCTQTSGGASVDITGNGGSTVTLSLTSLSGGVWSAGDPSVNINVIGMGGPQTPVTDSIT